MSTQPSNISKRGFTLGRDTADRFADPRFWEGCIGKRIFAYVIDVIVLAFVWLGLGLLAIVTLGLALPLTALAWALAPLVYHTLMVSKRGATLGQKFVGLRIVDASTGARPTILQSLMLTIGFYISVALWFVPLVYVLFDDKDRFLHDIFSNTRSVRAEKLHDPGDF